MRNVDDCPGEGKCHGPASWCNVCGDVDVICDDPACAMHARIEEMEEEFRTLAHDYTWARDHLDDLKKDLDGVGERIARFYRRSRQGAVKMVPRERGKT